MKQQVRRSKKWLARHWKWCLFGVLGAAVVVMISIQFAYPTSKLPPGMKIDGRSLGGREVAGAAAELDEAYAVKKTALYFGESPDPYRTPDLQTIGQTAHNEQRLQDVDYSWWLRLVPTSLFWAHSAIKVGEPNWDTDSEKIRHYAVTEFGEDCKVAPKNATAKIEKDTVVLVSSRPGGVCALPDVIAALEGEQPHLGDDGSLRLPVTPVAAVVTDEAVSTVLEQVNTRLNQPIKLQVGDETKQLSGAQVRSWLQFGTEGGVFTLSIDTAKAADPLKEVVGSTFEQKPGVTTVTTQDFREVSRVVGQPGRTFSAANTAESIATYLTGKENTAQAGGIIIPATVQYVRSYSSTDEGLSALIKNYAESQPGVFGVSLVELSGAHRRAGYQDTKQFTTASTYKLYVAYSTLKRVESGVFSWNDQIVGGRNLATCFDDMIVKSDNPCSEELVRRIGYRPLTDEARGLGLANTTFLNPDGHKTTAADLSTFMASLEMGQLPISSDSRARFIGALKRNVYRQGIPAGASGQTADKVGFLNGLLHDAAIVYGPSGTYALSIMTDGSSWGAIAQLTREIEKLRAQ